eukprot:1156081-Pelagomonas_calceolata.AAC.4
MRHGFVPANRLPAISARLSPMQPSSAPTPPITPPPPLKAPEGAMPSGSPQPSSNMHPDAARVDRTPRHRTLSFSRTPAFGEAVLGVVAMTDSMRAARAKVGVPTSAMSCRV